MQHLKVSCAVRRFFKSLGIKGLSHSGWICDDLFSRSGVCENSVFSIGFGLLDPRPESNRSFTLLYTM